MRVIVKAVLYFIGIMALLVAGYIGYLTLTYIDETVVEGEAYGFKVGATKHQAFSDIKSMLNRQPKLVVYIDYGPRAGDNMTVEPVDSSFPTAAKFDSWWLLLDGKGEFFNIIRLRFNNQVLAEIHRHRQHFELP